MYFLVVVALIGGIPQSLAGAFKDLPSCRAKAQELVQIVTSDASITHYSVDCVKGYEPGKAM